MTDQTPDSDEVLPEKSVVHAAAVGTDDVKDAREKKPKSGKRKKKAKKGKAAGGLGSSRGVETMFRTSYRTHVDLSHLADNKANIMISINGIIISILLASISPKIDANPSCSSPPACF